MDKAYNSFAVWARTCVIKGGSASKDDLAKLDRLADAFGEASDPESVNPYQAHVYFAAKSHAHRGPTDATIKALDGACSIAADYEREQNGRDPDADEPWEWWRRGQMA